MRAAYAMRRARLMEGLADIPGVEFTVPQGAFYVFVDASSFGLPSDELALRILELGNVVVTPGTYYGPGGEGHLRLSFASSDDAIDRGVEGLARAAEQLRDGTP
jgi:aspartate aminotransferase